MTRSTGRRFITPLLAANAAFWTLFWAFFLWNSQPAPVPLSEHLFAIYHTHPEYVSVLGRALGDGFPKPIVVTAVVVHFPSFLAAYPLGHSLPGDIVLAQTNHRGLMLLAVTVLSFAQWYLAALAVGWLASRRVPTSGVPAR